MTASIIQKEFSHLQSIYFNTAYFGPSPLRAKSYIERATQRELDPSFYPQEEWLGVTERLRGSLGRLIDAPADHIALVTSVTDIMNVIANDIHLEKGDEVCTLNREYPSDVLAWQLKRENDGTPFTLLSSPFPTADWLRENLPSKTKVFIISHVAFESGRKVNLVEIGKLMRERDILFIVDVTQSLGGMPIKKEELQFIDVMVCSCYKWMLGPYGTAFAYFSSKALNQIKHRQVNWLTSINSKNLGNLLDYSTIPLPGARRFDRGQTPNMLANSCLEASLDFFFEVGLDRISQHNSDLRDYFLNHFPNKKFQILCQQEDRKNYSNILALQFKGTDHLNAIISNANNAPNTLMQQLRAHNIDASIREGSLRISFHIFNTHSQVETLLEALNNIFE
jgi:cysteine desulfurase/selenocysteine lyase